VIITVIWVQPVSIFNGPGRQTERGDHGGVNVVRVKEKRQERIHKYPTGKNNLRQKVDKKIMRIGQLGCLGAHTSIIMDNRETGRARVKKGAKKRKKIVPVVS